MKTKSNRINYSNYKPSWSNYYYYHSNNSQMTENKDVKQDTSFSSNSKNWPKAYKQDLMQAKPESSLLTETEAATNNQNSLDPFIALEKLCSISFNSKKQKQN